MALSRFCQIKWEHAWALRREGKLLEARMLVDEILTAEDLFVQKEILRLKGLSRAGGPVLFENLVRDTEEDSSFTQSLWSCLASSPAEEIFMGEKISPPSCRRPLNVC